MPMTARRHFDEDISRAESMLDESGRLATAGSSPRLVGDIRTSSIALAVGALDAYLCDAYVDCPSSVLRAYVGGHWRQRLPSAYATCLLPAGVVLDTARRQRRNWSIRMAARAIMARDSMLSISRVPDAFNAILPVPAKIWSALLPAFLARRRRRFTGPLDATQIQALRGTARDKAKKAAISAVKTRVSSIIQVRHDWIHNCGRPRSAIDDCSDGEARSRLADIKAFVVAFDDHIEQHRLV